MFLLPLFFVCLFLFKDITLFSLRRDMKPAFNRERMNSFPPLQKHERRGEEGGCPGATVPDKSAF